MIYIFGCLVVVVVVLIAIIYLVAEIQERVRHQRVRKLISTDEAHDAFVFNEVSKGVFDIAGNDAHWHTHGRLLIGESTGLPREDLSFISLQVSPHEPSPPLLNYAMGANPSHSLNLLKHGPARELNPFYTGLATMTLAMGNEVEKLDLTGYTYTASLLTVLSLMEERPGGKILKESNLYRFIEHIIFKDGAIEVAVILPLSEFRTHSKTREGLISLCAHYHDWATSLFYNNSRALQDNMIAVLRATDTPRMKTAKKLALHGLLAHSAQLDPDEGDWLEVLIGALCKIESSHAHVFFNLSPLLCEHLPTHKLIAWYELLSQGLDLQPQEVLALAMIERELGQRFSIEYMRATGSLPWEASEEELARWRAPGCSIVGWCNMVPDELAPMVLEFVFLNDPERCDDPEYWQALSSLLARCKPAQEQNLFRAVQRFTHHQHELACELFEALGSGNFSHIPLILWIVENSGEGPPEHEALWIRIMHELELDFMLTNLLARFEVSSSWRLLVAISKNSRHGQRLRQDSVFGMRAFQLYTSFFTQPPTQEMKQHAGSLAQLVCMLCHNDEWVVIHDSHRDKFDEMCKDTLAFFDGEPITAEVFMAFKELLGRAPQSLKKPLTQALTRWEHRGIRGGLMEVGQTSQGGLTLDS